MSGIDREPDDATQVDGTLVHGIDPPTHPGQSGGMGESPPQRVGPYRILRLLGRGGMGEVWLGERDDGRFRQTVAVKLSRAHQREDLLRRLLAERSILASLEHPGIARLLDGGTTEHGLPYLAMEYVDGVPLDEWLGGKPSLKQRLDLFVKICDAVQYAHQKLVVHRDLKPANILVTSSDEPKLLDFGIARLLDQDPALEQSITGTGLSVMTPSYASPEQVRGLVVGTGSDLYTLGLILYEMLVDSRPYDLSSTTRPSEVEHLICDIQPVKPSQRASSRALRRALQGDLDNIVMMALRKEPERRYPSASAMAEDIERHHLRLPVRARPDTLLYRSQRFVQRNRVFVIAAVLLLGTLIAGLVRESGLRGLAEQAQARAERALEEAEQQRRRAQAVTDLMSDSFAAADVRTGGRRDLTVVDALDRALPNAAKYLDVDPATYAEAVRSVVTLKRSYERHPESESDLLQALQLLEGRLDSADPIWPRLFDLLADAIAYQGRISESVPWFERAYQQRVSQLGEHHAETLVARSRLADIMSADGRQTEGVDEQRIVVELMRTHLGEHAPQTMTATRFLSGQLMGARRNVEALDLMQQHRDALLAVGQQDSNEYAILLYRICLMRWTLRGVVAAWPDCQAMRKRMQDGGWDADGRSAASLNLLGNIMRDIGQPQLAVAYFQRSEQLAAQSFGAMTESAALPLQNLAHAYLELGQVDLARDAAERSLRAREAALGAVHERSLRARMLLDLIRGLQGEAVDRQVMAAVRERMDVNDPAMNWVIPNALAMEGELALASADLPAARELFEQAVEMLGESLEQQPDPLHYRAYRRKLAQIYEDLGDLERAEQLRREAFQPGWQSWLPDLASP